MNGERYATLFDRRYLPQGLALRESLLRRDPSALLWVLCLDRATEEALARLDLPRTRLIGLDEAETPELAAARRDRSGADYIFTLTPFLFEFVFQRDPGAGRVTYVDADVYFFRSPAPLLAGLDESDRPILLTEHGFAPELQYLTGEFGRFCVQFLTISPRPESLRVLREWQRQCLESCSTEPGERGRVYGEQKYLDAWPERHAGLVHVCPLRREILAPWNADYYLGQFGRYAPILYHFHSLRLFRPGWVQLCSGFNPRQAAPLYAAYLAALRRQHRALEAAGIPRETVPVSPGRLWLPRLAWRCLTGRARVRPFPRVRRGFRPVGAPAQVESLPLEHGA